MLEAARSGAREGTWLRAERQTGGRGRMGRRWDSPAGNLYASTIVRLKRSDPPAATLALVAAVALHDAIGPQATIKWPNDLLIDGAKCAGILLERGDDAVVIGFGVNVAACPDDLDRAVTCLAQHGMSGDAQFLFDRLIEGFARQLARWRESMALIVEHWLAAAHPPGTALRVNLGDGTIIAGNFAGLDPDGALRLRLADGSIRAIHAGDVFLL